MTRSTTAVSLAFVGAALVGAICMWPSRLSPPEAPDRPATAEGQPFEATDPAPAVPPTPAVALVPAIASPASPAIRSAPTVGQVAALLNDLDRLFEEPEPGIAAEQVKDLIARRTQASRHLVDQLADLGPGSARPIAELYQQTEILRDRLLLAEALGKVQDPEAVAAIGDLLAGEQGYFERQKLITALGQRPEAAAIEPLSGIVSGNSAGGLKFAAVQGLSGRPEALPALGLTIDNGSDQAVRLEAIRSVGRIGTEAALSTLVSVAQKPELPTVVRQTAIHELRRSFGAAAVDTLQSLSAGPASEVRDTAGQALSMLRRNRAVK